jgi:DNA ligase-1
MFNFKPMLAATLLEEHFTSLKFPLIGSPKLDGIRAIMVDGKLMSRSMKPIRNTHIQNTCTAMNGCDGELIVGSANSTTCFLDTTSAVMRIKGEPQYTFCVFENYLDTRSFGAKVDELHLSCGNARTIEQRVLNSVDELISYEEQCLAAGYEGIMLRDPDSKYKFGRSTVKEGSLFKLKRFADAEGTVVGFVEQMKNTNEKEVNELGNSFRSSCKENLVPMNTLGALVLYFNAKTIEVGTGFTKEQRQHIWDYRDRYKGFIAKYKYFPYGAYATPRFPVFLGFRDEDDTSV